MVKPLQQPRPSPRARAPLVHFGETDYVMVEYERSENANPEARLVECDNCAGKFSRSPKPGCSMILKTSPLNWLCTACFVAGAPREYNYDSESEQVTPSIAEVQSPSEDVQPEPALALQDVAHDVSVSEQPPQPAVSAPDAPDELSPPPKGNTCLEILPVLKNVSGLLAASEDQHIVAVAKLLLQLNNVLQQRLSQVHAKQKLADEVSSMRKLHTIVKELTNGLKRLQSLSLQIGEGERAPLKPLPNGHNPRSFLSSEWSQTLIKQLQKLCDALLKEEMDGYVKREVAAAVSPTASDRLSRSLPSCLDRFSSERNVEQKMREPSRAVATVSSRPSAKKSKAQQASVSPRYGMPQKSKSNESVRAATFSSAASGNLSPALPPGRILALGNLSPAPPRERAGCRPASGVERGSFAAACQNRFPSSSPPRLPTGQAGSPSQVSRTSSSGHNTARLSLGRAESPSKVCGSTSSQVKGPTSSGNQTARLSLRKAEVPHAAGRQVPMVTARTPIGTPEVPYMRGHRMPFGHPCHQQMRHPSAPCQHDVYITVGVSGRGSLCLPSASRLFQDRAL